MARALRIERPAGRYHVTARGDRREQKSLRDGPRPASWAEIVSAVERAKGESWEDFADRHGDWGRDAALWLGRRAGRLRLAQLGQLAGGLDYAVVSKALPRFGQRLGLDASLHQQLTALQNDLSKCQDATPMFSEHPFRFVFLYACDTLDDRRWTEAFSIHPPPVSPWDYKDNPGAAQAFVGWIGECKEPNSWDGWAQFQFTLAYFFSSWMDQKHLLLIYQNSQKPNAPDGQPFPMPFVPRYQNTPYNKMDLVGCGGLKRTGIADEW